MNDLECKKVSDIQQELMALYNRLIDLTGGGTKKRRTEQENLLLDAMDSLEESIAFLEEALDE